MGTSVCSRCGSILNSNSQTLTVNPPGSAVRKQPVYETDTLAPEQQLFLVISTEILILPVRPKLTLGRFTVSSPSDQPDIDLTPYLAFDKGVSRLHAAILRKDNSVTLVDMASRNGTWLNGKRLPSYYSQSLRNGDEIVLGKLSITINFVKAP